MTDSYRRILELLDAPPSPLQAVEWPAATAAGVELYVKRDELLDPRISGNKWRKLLPQIAWHLRQGKTRFATVGGIHSNHIPAFAALMERLDSKQISNLQSEKSDASSSLNSLQIAYLQSGKSQSSVQSQSKFHSHVAYVRGQLPSPLSPSLAFAKTCGLQLRSATREQVRTWRTSTPSAQELDSATWIPEGGTNKLGLLGMAYCYREIKQQLGRDPTAIITAVGSGGTAAGLARKANCPIYAMDVVGDKGLPDRVKKILSPIAFDRIRFLPAQLKGFASGESDILQTMLNFKGYTGIQLDPIYTAKALFKLDQLLWRGEFEAGSKIVFLHTGGLQGLDPWMKRYWS